MPLHVAYTEMAPLVAMVHRTNIFRSDSVQFVLTAYVHAYPNGVVSAWVYVAALDDMRAGRQPRIR